MFGLSETKQIMIQIESFPSISLSQIADHMPPISGVVGLLKTGLNLNFKDGVSISESIIFENTKFGPSTGLGLMFLHENHLIMFMAIGVNSLTALAADSDFTSVMSGITFQSDKPEDVGSQGGGSGDYTPFNGQASSGQSLCASETGITLTDSSCDSSSTITLVRFGSGGTISLPVDSSNNDVWTVSGCGEFSANDIQGDTIVINSSGVKITNPCTFTLKNDANAKVSLFFTLNGDGTYSVEETTGEG